MERHNSVTSVVSKQASKQASKHGSHIHTHCERSKLGWVQAGSVLDQMHSTISEFYSKHHASYPPLLFSSLLSVDRRDQLKATELYDHEGDDGPWTDPDRFENVNLAKTPANVGLVKQLSAQMHAAFGYPDA